MKLILSISYLATWCFSISFCHAQQLEYFSNHDGINDFLFEEEKMWIATQGGLLELDLDGNLIKKHTVLDGINAARVEHIVQDAKGTRYIETSDREKSIQIYKAGRWENYSGFVENEFIHLIHSNGLFGYLHQSKDNIYLQFNGEWKKYMTDLKGYELDEIMIVDNEKNLWVACKGGVIRHDGKAFKKYTFLDEYQTPAALLKDKNGILWALDSWKNWYLFDIEKDSWSACLSKECQQISKSAFSFSDTEGNLWFTNEEQDSLYKYDGKHWTWIAVPVRAVPKSIDEEDGRDWLFCGEEDKQGNLWFGSRFGNLYKYNGKKWMSFDISSPDYLIKDRNLQRTSSIIEDKDKNVWITGSDFVNYYNVAQDESTFFERHDFEGNFEFAYVSAESIVEGENGNMYINPQQGVFRYDRGQENWEYMLGREDIASMYYDKEENKIFFLNDNGQLITIDKKEGTTTFTTIVEKTNERYLLYRAIEWDDKGGLWISAQEKLYYYNYKKDTRSIFDTENSPIDIAPEVIYEDLKGNIWTNIKGGVAYWNGKKWVTFTDKNTLLENIAARKQRKLLPITEDKNGNIIVRSNGFVFSWDGTQWRSWRQWNTCLDGSYTGSLFVDSQNNLWIFNNKKSIYKCTGIDCIPIVTNYEADYVDVLEDKKGRIWILTEFGGIFRYNENQ